MCGINGFNFKDEKLIQKMNEQVKHRGPDDSGFWVDDGISLGHQRLSIIDLSERGHQPMIWLGQGIQPTQATGGRLGPLTQSLAIVFNGEIYNFKEIKKELSDYQFKSESDTEVILAAYDKWGKECLQKLNGIFAFAIWDKEKKELFLARDRVGVKPLYYYFKNDKFIFSSEIKAILEHSCVKREIDLEALNHYFRVLYVPGPLTMFKEIKKLEPGCYLSLKYGQVTIKRYWDINERSDEANRSELRYRGIQTNIQDLMLDAVGMQLVSDRPLGVFLSGGIDSTSVLGNMVKLGHRKIKTFSVGFDVNDPNDKFNGDFNLARQTAKHYNTEHHEIKISAKDILENIEDVIRHLDEPICNTTQVATYLLSKFAKEKVAVVLGGDGGDELFGGYERYRLSYVMSKMGVLAKLGKLFGKNLDYPKGIERYAKFMFQDGNEVNRVLSKGVNKARLTHDFYKNKFEEIEKQIPLRQGFGGQGNKETKGTNDTHGSLKKDFEKQFMMMDFKTWLVDESLMRTDKMTMAFGLEQRVPILDHRLVELAYQIPSKMKLGILKNQTKLIWKQAMDEFLPEHVKKSAHKKVWLAPMSEWLRTDLKGWAKEVLSKDYVDTSEYINFREVQKMFDDHCERRKYNLHLIWAVITFQLWYRRFIIDN
ncbi:asparagine synthase (glutamine-hydrolyzing) [Patescibacteria group bacterium]|nr:asparagine synthase (glutamine-hydrolyzing) [Patescibacteria group bacterium]MBU4512528.1 asparagine synthase (glutamine-hydrolyzing) [Patescibacteria group bacterium]MCG2693493.1 asparagine synthase (glutamine-hydrolyzing) [Candidatus Parcubacteria bacterium]